MLTVCSSIAKNIYLIDVQTKLRCFGGFFYCTQGTTEITEF